MDTIELGEKDCKWFEQHLTQRIALEAALQGAMSLLAAQNGEGGRWELDWARRRIVRADSLVPVPAEALANGPGS